MEKSKIAVIILTFNEEKNLSRCLESIKDLADEIFVVDSHSTDKTREIAKNFGAKVLEHDFKNQAEQFNWALDNLNVESEWILKLDADEYLLPELKEEILQTPINTDSGRIKADDGISKNQQHQYKSADVNGYYMKRRVYFMGRWIRYGGYYPVWFLRLWRKGMGRSEERKMDEHIILFGGRAEKLKNDFVDDNLNGLGRWIQKHKNYALREAEEIRAGKFGEGKRRSFYYRLPPFIRPFFYFAYRYFVRFGFLDGFRGLIFHFLHGFWYRLLVDYKIYRPNK